MKARTRRASRPVSPQPAQAAPARPYHIYELVEIIDQGYPRKPFEQIFYVGMTNDPKGRYLQHAAGDENERKTTIFRHAQKFPDDITIDMRILDSTLDVEVAKRLEAYWILYRTLQGCDLTNTTAGACFLLHELDESHYDRLTRMLHDTFGCCKSGVCIYATEQAAPRVVPVYVAQPVQEPASIWKRDFFSDFFARFWGK